MEQAREYSRLITFFNKGKVINNYILENIETINIVMTTKNGSKKSFKGLTEVVEYISKRYSTKDILIRHKLKDELMENKNKILFGAYWEEIR